MYRHSPVRNQRSKGIKTKHVLQVCLLVAVCFWLIFQVKRSHDKKKEFDMKIPSNRLSQSSDEMVKFGRKDLKPKLEETIKEVDVHEEGQEHEQEEEEEQEHDEENKHEEEDQEHDDENKHEEVEEDHDEENKHEEDEQEVDKIEEEKDDGGGGGDDEIDENEQEKSDVEIDREEMETIDEDKETEENEEKESEEKDEQSQTENGVSSDENDDGTTVHTNEAREEHYKADDASSAVTHDARTLGSENENGNVTLDNSSENVGLVDNGETVENVTSANNTMIQEKVSESVGTLNATTSIDSNDNGPPSSTTMSTSDSTQAQNTTENIMVSGEQSGNSTIATFAEETQESSNSTNISESHESKTEDMGTNPIKTEVETNSGEVESITDETVENLDPDALQHDTIDSSDPLHLDEKEVRTDLDTLPEIETEGGNSEDTAAE